MRANPYRSESVVLVLNVYENIQSDEYIQYMSGETFLIRTLIGGDCSRQKRSTRAMRASELSVNATHCKNQQSNGSLSFRKYRHLRVIVDSTRNYLKLAKKLETLVGSVSTALVQVIVRELDLNVWVQSHQLLNTRFGPNSSYK